MPVAVAIPVPFPFSVPPPLALSLAIPVPVPLSFPVPVPVPVPVSLPVPVPPSIAVPIPIIICFSSPVPVSPKAPIPRRFPPPSRSLAVPGPVAIARQIPVPVPVPVLHAVLAPGAPGAVVKGVALLLLPLPVFAALPLRGPGSPAVTFLRIGVSLIHAPPAIVAPVTPRSTIVAAAPTRSAARALPTPPRCLLVRHSLAVRVARRRARRILGVIGLHTARVSVRAGPRAGGHSCWSARRGLRSAEHCGGTRGHYR